jgi:hypothetical protein
MLTHILHFYIFLILLLNFSLIICALLWPVISIALDVSDATMGLLEGRNARDLWVLKLIVSSDDLPELRATGVYAVQQESEA